MFLLLHLQTPDFFRSFMVTTSKIEQQNNLFALPIQFDFGLYWALPRPPLSAVRITLKTTFETASVRSAENRKKIIWKLTWTRREYFEKEMKIERSRATRKWVDEFQIEWRNWQKVSSNRADSKENEWKGWQTERERERESERAKVWTEDAEIGARTDAKCGPNESEREREREREAE
jgi:hypothetical protein